MEYVVNNESGNVFKIIMLQRYDASPDGTPGAIRYAHIERLYDGYQARLGDNFEIRYRPLTTEEAAQLIIVGPTFQARRMKLNARDLQNTVNADSSTSNIAEVGTLVEPGTNDTLDNLIVTDEVRNQIQMGITLIQNRQELDTEWGLNEVEPMVNRCIMNLVGPPGTGKTKSARTIAAMLGKKLYQVDYSTIISKYVGDTAKNIKAAFVAAKAHNAILFFDEADSLMSKRLSMPEDGVANSINQNRNVLMQELDRYDGIMLTATNFFVNYDEALLRRISTHVHYDLPTEAMRAKLIEQHIPAKAKAKMEPSVSIANLAQLSEGLSGGDILVVCTNAVKRAFMEAKRDGIQGVLQQAHLVSEIEAVKRNKLAHSGVRNATIQSRG